jgi:hypothetical protein
MKNLNMKKFIVLCLAMGVMVIFTACGAYEQEPSNESTTNNTFQISGDLDLDGDGYGDFGLPGGDKSVMISNSCSTAPDEATEEMCVEHYNSALMGIGDCKKVDYASDVALCSEVELDCANAKYSICAFCVNPGAVEVLDGIDNDCDGLLMDGECATDEDCAEGVCDPDTHTCTGCLQDVDCTDDNPCTDDTCEAGVCTFTNNTEDCDDGDACTENDVCSEGTCGGADMVCDDDNPCTDDSCEPATGCTFTNNVAECDDGDACTTDDTCADGQCVGGDAPDCDDDDACTVDACDPATGCVNTPASCDDGNICTDDSCDPATGCVNTDVVCDDGNDCTEDSCDPDSEDGCVFTPITGCAASCDPANDAGGEDNGDCAPYRDPALGNAYGWGCYEGTCVAYEDLDGDEWADEPEEYCSDGIDGDLDGLMDCLDPDCAADPACFVPDCEDDTDCDEGFMCTDNVCVEIPCVPACDGFECGADGCGGSCGNCDEGFVCQVGLCEEIPAPVPEGAGDCSDGIDNDLDGLIDCEEAACDGASCGAGMTCQAGVCAETPDGDEVFVTITVEAPAPTEAWIYGSGVVESGLTPFSVELTAGEACKPAGIEIAARLTSGTWPWYGCDEGAPSIMTLVVKVNGEVVEPTTVNHPWVCGGEGEGNLKVSATQMGCL